MKFLKSLVTVLVPVLLVLTAGPAMAQDGGDKQGMSTVILQFQQTNVPEELMDDFYLTLNEEIDKQDDMHVVEGGEVTIDEMILTVGCDSPNPSCLAGLSDFVDADRMVFGSIQRSKNSYLFSMKMFDFAEERFVREMSEQTVEGDIQTVKDINPAIIESFMYGDVGKLKVETQGGNEPRVFFDNEKMGPAPTTLKNLPLGQHAVSVKTADATKETEIVVLRKGKTSVVSFDFGGGEEPIEGGGGGGGGLFSGDGMSILPGAAVTGVGLAGVVFGLVNNLQVGKLNREAQASLARTPSGEVYVKRGELTSSNSNPAYHAQRTKGAQVRTAVGYSVGAVGLGVGGYLLYRALAPSAEGNAGKPAAQRVTVSPNKEGVSFGVSLDFK